MRKFIDPIREYVFAAGIGGVVYALLEILWRGYTHWSMILAGAACASLLYWIRKHLEDMPLFVQCLLGTVGITLVELAVGCVVSFAVSLLVIKGLMEYVRNHSFKAFGVYRIILGIAVLGYFVIKTL